MSANQSYMVSQQASSAIKNYISFGILKRIAKADEIANLIMDEDFKEECKKKLARHEAVPELIKMEEELKNPILYKNTLISIQKLTYKKSKELREKDPNKENKQIQEELYKLELQRGTIRFLLKKSNQMENQKEIFGFSGMMSDQFINKIDPQNAYFYSEDQFDKFLEGYVMNNPETFIGLIKHSMNKSGHKISENDVRNYAEDIPPYPLKPDFFSLPKITWMFDIEEDQVEKLLNNRLYDYIEKLDNEKLYDEKPVQWLGLKLIGSVDFIGAMDKFWEAQDRKDKLNIPNSTVEDITNFEKKLNKIAERVKLLYGKDLIQAIDLDEIVTKLIDYFAGSNGYGSLKNSAYYSQIKNIMTEYAVVSISLQRGLKTSNDVDKTNEMINSFSEKMKSSIEEHLNFAENSILFKEAFEQLDYNLRNFEEITEANNAITKSKLAETAEYELKCKAPITTGGNINIDLSKLDMSSDEKFITGIKKALSNIGLARSQTKTAPNLKKLDTIEAQAKLEKIKDRQEFENKIREEYVKQIKTAKIIHLIKKLIENKSLSIKEVLNACKPIVIGSKNIEDLIK